MDESDGSFWYKIAAWAFGLWAVMIPLGVSMIRSAISASATTQDKFLADFHAYVLQMERRVTILEERMRDIKANGDSKG
jgi:hypothetical protein